MAQTTIFTYNDNDLAKEKKQEKIVVGKDNKSKSAPFRCCYEPAKKTIKRMSYNGLDYAHDIWQCGVCGKEYIDSQQAQKMEKFLFIEKLLNGNLISMKRKMNFDGKAFFFRFPKEISQNWGRESSAEIKIVTPETFLVEIKKGK